ncbi:hypothetical protein ASG94_13605 [Nocardioides sp. Soil805]|nr:hypothetical protein ASG94_13605 [Nocardioides sp. Soil805]
MARVSTPEPRTCASCGRTIEWRKKWERDWDSVRYCSAACRRRRTSPQDEALEAAVADLLARSSRATGIAASDAARAVGGDDWRELVEPARRAARRLAAAGEVEIVQGGRAVDPSTARGEFRIRRR